MSDKKGGSLHINYQLKAGVGKPDDKIKINLNTTHNGVHVVYSAGIAELDEEGVARVGEMLANALDFLDDKDATTENHILACRAAQNAFGVLADQLEQGDA